MNKKIKSRLPKKGVDREALNNIFSNIKPRLFLSKIGGFLRLKQIFSKMALIGVICFVLLGYFPNFTFRAVLPAKVEASEQQLAEIVALALPKPVNLPHPGYLSSKYSRWHPGIDIATGLGMPIHPIIDGEVEQVGYGFWGYGNHVIVSHAEGFKSLYAHMGRIFVKQGQKVTDTTILGEVGMTGFTSGPHTHLEITKNGSHIDPLTVLPEIPLYPQHAQLVPHRGGRNLQLNETKTELHKSLKLDL